MKKISSRLLPLSLALLLLTSCGGGGDSSDTETSTAESSTSSSSVETPVGSSSSSSSEAEQEDDPPAIEEDQNEIVSIEISSRSSHRVDFELNKRFHHGGLVIETVTRGGKKEETNDFTVDSSAYKADTVGTYKINVKLNSNNNVSLSYDVRVVDIGSAEASPVSIRLASDSNYISKYVDGECFIADGLNIEAVYPNGSVISVPSNCLCFKLPNSKSYSYSAYLCLSDKDKSEETINLTVKTDYFVADKEIQIPVTIYNPSNLTPTSLSMISSADKTHFAFDSSDLTYEMASSLSSARFAIKYAELGDREISTSRCGCSSTSDGYMNYWMTYQGSYEIVTATFHEPTSVGEMRINFSTLNSSSVSSYLDFYFIDTSSDPIKIDFVNGYTPIKEYYPGESLENEWGFEMGIFYSEKDYVELDYDDVTLSCPDYDPYAQAGSKFVVTVSLAASYGYSLSLDYEITLLPLDIAGSYGIPFSSYFGGSLSESGLYSSPDGLSLDGIYLLAVDAERGFAHDDSNSAATIRGNRSKSEGIIYYYSYDSSFSIPLAYDISKKTFVCKSSIGGQEFQTVKFDESIHSKTTLTLPAEVRISLFSKKGTKIPAILFALSEDGDCSLKSDFDLESYSGKDVRVTDPMSDYSDILFAPNPTGDYSSCSFPGEYKLGTSYAFKLYPNGIGSNEYPAETGDLFTYTAEPMKDAPNNFTIVMNNDPEKTYTYDALTDTLKKESNVYERIDRTKEAMVDYSYDYYDGRKITFTLVLPLGEVAPDFIDKGNSNWFTKIDYKGGIRPIIKGDTTIEVDDVTTFECVGAFGGWKDCYAMYYGHLFKIDGEEYKELEYELVDYADNVLTIKLKKDGTIVAIDTNRSELTIGGITYEGDDFFDDFPINSNIYRTPYVEIGGAEYCFSLNERRARVGINKKIDDDSYSPYFSGCIIYCRENDDGNYVIGLFTDDESIVETLYTPSTSTISLLVNGISFSYFLPFNFELYPFEYCYGAYTFNEKNASVRFADYADDLLSVLQVTIYNNNHSEEAVKNYSVKKIEKTDTGYKITYLDGEKEGVATYSNKTGFLSMNIDGETYLFPAGRGELGNDKRFNGNSYSWQNLNGEEKIDWAAHHFYITDTSGHDTRYYITDVKEENGYYLFTFTTDGVNYDTAKYNISTRTFEAKIGEKTYSFKHQYPLDGYEFVGGYYSLAESGGYGSISIYQSYSYFYVNDKSTYVRIENVEETDGGYEIVLSDSSDSSITYEANYDKNLKRMTLVVDGISYVFQKRLDIPFLGYYMVSANDDGASLYCDGRPGNIIVYDSEGEGKKLLDAYYAIDYKENEDGSITYTVVHNGVIKTIVYSQSEGLTLPSENGNYVFKKTVSLKDCPFYGEGFLVSLNEDGEDIAMTVGENGFLNLYPNNHRGETIARFYVLGVTESDGVYTLDCVKDGHKTILTYDSKTRQMSFSIDEKQYLMQLCPKLDSDYLNDSSNTFGYQGSDYAHLSFITYDGYISLDATSDGQSYINENFYVYNTVEAEGSYTIQYVYKGKKYETVINDEEAKLVLVAGEKEYAFTVTTPIDSYPFCTSGDAYDWYNESQNEATSISFYHKGCFCIRNYDDGVYLNCYIYEVEKNGDVYSIKYTSGDNRYVATYNEKTRVFETTIGEDKYSFTRKEIDTQVIRNTYEYKTEDGKAYLLCSISSNSDSTYYINVYIHVTLDDDVNYVSIYDNSVSATVDSESGTATFVLSDDEGNTYYVIYDYVNNEFTVRDSNNVSTRYIVLNS